MTGSMTELYSPQFKPTEALFNRSPIIAVVSIDKLENAVPIAQALAEGGVDVIEVTLRTKSALKAIEAIAREVSHVAVGAGTVCDRTQQQAVLDAGAQFAFSPGATLELLEAYQDSPIPFVPGVSSATEVLTAKSYGYYHMKLFPAEVVGGRALLKALGAPIPEVRFCPTGGVRMETAADYLALPNVSCVGGSWLLPADVQASGNWAEVTRLAKASLAQLKQT
ncbi:bifunctional 4-hydroxy-2-oxoglutarate aldolase/2-dehydro-3-deoxy-phosphogluconate aldolase [Allohahella sp. A8]|uniref:bifunctional 4-hydroxy-2-oxoglutarate aldolase/2-dehydro-3-deoxy-phosphogluconate aldolase n=1 Tax=Allohahella sp. A8 TaxID=3141461 RepID=UPI003A80B851